MFSFRMYRFRPCLDDVYFTSDSVLSPFNVHWLIEVILDQNRHFSQNHALLPFQWPLLPHVKRHSNRRHFICKLIIIDKHLLFSPQSPMNYRRFTLPQPFFPDRECVWDNNSLNNQLSQPVRGPDVYHSVVAGIRINGEHHPWAGLVGSGHFHHDYRHSAFKWMEPILKMVTYGSFCEHASDASPPFLDNLNLTAYIEKRLILSGEWGVFRIFSSRWWPHSNIHSWVVDVT